MTTLTSAGGMRRLRSFARLFIVSFVFGVAGYGVGWWLARVFPDGPSLSDLGLGWADGLALLVAFGLIFGAAAALVTSLSPARLGRMYRLEGDASPTEIGLARRQALVFGFSGLLLTLPPIFSAAGLSPLFGFVVVGLLMALHTVLNLRVYLQADELVRRTVLEAGAATFFLGQGVLFLWAAAERLGFAPALTAWDIYAVLMAFYLIASVVVSVRRGLT